MNININGIWYQIDATQTTNTELDIIIDSDCSESFFNYIKHKGVTHDIQQDAVYNTINE